MSPQCKSKLTEADKERMKSMYASGKLLKEIATVFGVSSPTVSRWIGRHSRPKPIIPVDEIHNLYDRGFTPNEISQKLSVPRRRVYDTLNDKIKHKQSGSFSRLGWVTNHPYQYALREEDRKRYREVVEMRKQKNPEAGYDYKEAHPRSITRSCLLSIPSLEWELLTTYTTERDVMETTLLTLTITTPKRTYEVRRTTEYTDTGKTPVMIVEVTTRNKNTSSRECFTIRPNEVEFPTTKGSLERWFYDSFAGQYADYYAGNPSEHAEILYDLGHYTVVDVDMKKEPGYEIDENSEHNTSVKASGVKQEYYVRTKDGVFSPKAFSTPEDAERWAYSSICNDDITVNAVNQKLFTVFSINE